MNRALLLAVCLILGCGSNQESKNAVSESPAQASIPQKTASETPAQAPAVVNEPPLQSILEWDFASWPKVTEKPELLDPKYWEYCVDMSRDAMRRRRDAKQDYGVHKYGVIQVRVNGIGLEQVKSGKPVPVGTVVIKEKHHEPTDQATLDRLDRPFAVAAMIKRKPGYDPEHGDWEYAYQINTPAADRSTTRGKLTSCIGCHQNMKD